MSDRLNSSTSVVFVVAVNGRTEFKDSVDRSLGPTKKH